MPVSLAEKMIVEEQSFYKKEFVQNKEVTLKTDTKAENEKK